MFRSFTVKNFRCFQDLTIEPLARVNLIAGKNNVGKTALLEALFLHLGANNPQVPVSINILRGIEQSSTDPRDLWGWLFYGKRVGDAIELVSLEDGDLRRRLRVSLAAPLTTTVTAGAQAGTTNGEMASERGPALLTTALGPTELRMEYDDSAGRSSTASGSIVYEGERPGFRLLRAPVDPYPMALFLTTRFRSSAEDAARFSRMVELGREAELLETLKALDPSLSRLMVLVIAGVPIVGGVAGTALPIPLPLMGEGLARLLSVLLAISDALGGVVLIDEIENGLHYSTLVDMWRAIGKAARESNTQIIATTHSWECIRAAHAAFNVGDGDDAFRLFRLDRPRGEIRAVSYDAEMLEAALSTGLEIR